MPHLPSLPDPALFNNLLARHPENVQSLVVYTNDLPRGELVATMAKG